MNSVTESVSLLQQLSDVYQAFGLPPGRAWDAALADLIQV